MLPSVPQIIRCVFKLADWFGRRWTRVRLRWRPNAVSQEPFSTGLSVIVTDRAEVACLHDCLQGLKDACANVGENVEIIVSLSGSPASDYTDLMNENGSIRWLFSVQPLSFSATLRKGLEAAEYDWVYLLNSDLVLDSDALSSLLRWRSPRVFAISSQILPSASDSPHSRLPHEQTGWMCFRRGAGPLEIEPLSPDSEAIVRGNLCAAAGASLFRRNLLFRLLLESSVYDPFSWEDVEWGTRAWREGYEVLFCPASKARGEYRAAGLRFLSYADGDRIVKRNRLIYHLRNHVGDGSKGEFDAIVALVDRKTLREILHPRRMARILAGRLRTCFLNFRNLPLEYTWHKYYLNPPESTPKPTIVVVTPFSVYPPLHGGARRIHGILEALSDRFNLVLLSDEIDLYNGSSAEYFAPLASVQLTGGRRINSNTGRMARIANHTHFAVVEQLRFLISCYRPAAVQVEYVELSKIVELKDRQIPWFLTLHDVLLSERGIPSEEDQYEIRWIKQYNAVIVCSEEDARLVPHERVLTVPNSGPVGAADRTPSPERSAMLFLGPFRYPPNLAGMQEFLETVYSRLLRRVPELELWIFGGEDALRTAGSLECFDQPGVRVMDYTDRPRDWLDRCTLTINPLRAVRGSCVKVIESIAAGRVCVSTRDGARGFTNAGFPGLIMTNTVEEFIEPLERLLLDHNYRRSLECAPKDVLESFSWKKSADLQAMLYQQWISESPTASQPGF